MITAFAISIKNAPTRGTIMNAIWDTPNLLINADILAIAVSVAPIEKPPNPADISAAS